MSGQLRGDRALAANAVRLIRAIQRLGIEAAVRAEQESPGWGNRYWREMVERIAREQRADADLPF